MKTRKLIALLLAGLTALSLTGCSLARPEAEEPEQDRFAGLYMVYSPDGSRDEFYENPNLTELGSETVEAGGLGGIDVPRQVLPAQRDGEGEWTFPGLEGWALYCIEWLEDGVPTSAMVSDMADGSYHTTVADEGVTNELSGVLYIGPPEGAPADWTAYDMTGVWTPYFVYQTEDGQPYLDGSGAASSGGGIFSYRTEHTWTRTVDGETESVTVSAEARVEEVPRLAALTVRQYGSDGLPLGGTDIPLDGTDRRTAWLDGAAWALVEEISVTGGVTRAAYDRPGPGEDPVTHPFVVLDERGLGTPLTLTLE